jgi:hypothetical protein
VRIGADPAHRSASFAFALLLPEMAIVLEEATMN